MAILSLEQQFIEAKKRHEEVQRHRAALDKLAKRIEEELAAYADEINATEHGCHLDARGMKINGIETLSALLKRLTKAHAPTPMPRATPPGDTAPTDLQTPPMHAD